MRPRVALLLPGSKPTTVLSDFEFLLLGHIRKHGYLELTIEDVVFGTQGALRLTFPQQGWRLHVFLPAASAQVPPPSAPTPAPSAPPQADADASVRQRRDDILRRMFS
jgi:hypothetical protein